MTKFWVTEVGMVSIDYIIEAESEEAAKKLVEEAERDSLRANIEEREEYEFEVLDNVRAVTLEEESS